MSPVIRQWARLFILSGTKKIPDDMMMINVPKILLPSELVKKQQYRQKRRYWESHLTCKKPIWDLMCGGIRGKVFNSEIGGGGLMERQY